MAGALPGSGASGLLWLWVPRSGCLFFPQPFVLSGRRPNNRSRRTCDRGRHVPAPVWEERRVTSRGLRPKNQSILSGIARRNAANFANLCRDIIGGVSLAFFSLFFVLADMHSDRVCILSLSETFHGSRLCWYLNPQVHVYTKIPFPLRLVPSVSFCVSCTAEQAPPP